MFTGIIEEVGTVRELRRQGSAIRISVHGPLVAADAELGHSIAVNGACLTVVELDREAGVFAADVAPETTRRTNLGTLRERSPVNLERSLRLGDRLGGHLVTGHVDGQGRLARIKPEENAIWLGFELEPALLRYVVQKGSVTVDGISLTVAGLQGNEFGVSVVPHTMTHTNLPYRQIGDSVNIETDIIGKYIERLSGAVS